MSPPHTKNVTKKPGRIVVCPVETARAAVAGLEPGSRLFGFTKGQFSLLDLIQALLDRCGPCDVVLSTWTFGIRDAESARALLDRGRIRSLRMLTDRSFPTRQPRYAAALLSLFGPNAIRCTRTHAKFAVLQNEGWSLAVRSSMNLNRNPRYEQFDIDDDPDLCAFLLGHVREIEERMPQAFDFSTRQCDAVFAGSLGGGLSEVYSLHDDDHDGPVDMDSMLRSLNLDMPALF